MYVFLHTQLQSIYFWISTGVLHPFRFVNVTSMCVVCEFYYNAFHAAGECRRQVINLTNLVKNVKIAEFDYHIRNHNEKCIQISTNMPSIGLVIPEITCEMLEF